MKQIARWILVFGGSAACLIVFQNCAQSGKYTLEHASSFGVLGAKGIPATAIVAISPNPGSCPMGTQEAGSTGYLAGVCVELYNSVGTEVVADVQLMAAGAACLSGYTNVVPGVENLCAKLETIGQQTDIVTGLYEIPAGMSC